MLCNLCGCDTGDSGDLICPTCQLKEDERRRHENQQVTTPAKNATGDSRKSSLTTFGVLGIIFSVLAIVSSIYTAFSPLFLKMQSDIMEQMHTDMRQSGESSQEFESTMAAMKNMLDIPEWYGFALGALGIIGVIIGIVYLTACIFLLSRKNKGLKLFYVAFGSGIFLSVLKLAVTAAASQMLLIQALFYSVTGIVFHLVLFAIVYLNANSWDLAE